MLGARWSSGKDQPRVGTVDQTGTGADFLQLDTAAAPTSGRATWLAARIRDAVSAGTIGLGDLLPPSRQLAGELGWSRGVVVEAYQRLGEQGLVSARSRGGTRIALVPAAAAQPPSPPAAPVSSPSPAVGGGDVLDLTPGVPDLSLFPRSAWLRAEREVLTQLPASTLRYGDPAGDLSLRQALVSWLAVQRGLRTTADAVVIVTGVAQTLALTAHVLTRAGHSRVAVEDPGSRGARDELAYWGLAPVPVPVDAQGLRVEVLEQGPARVVVTTPAHQYPTGVAMSPQRRTELLRWAARTGGLVVEDDYDAEHRYDRAPTPALQPSAPESVLHTGSVSKALAPALRLGWAVVPEHLREAFVEAKHASDISSPGLAQLTFERLLSSGIYDQHLRRVRRHQRVRRDVLVAALGAVTAGVPGARVTGVAAGLHLLLELPGVDDAALVRALAAEGVVVDALSRHRVQEGPGGLVLGYASLAPHRLHLAAAAIGSALHEAGVRVDGRR
ncbi:MocR-like pyridoxine biosynthesis transcription factor PdxR [Quadrisphaera oryzae]|uniref:MocR-like pyridoxine biosynthesis transcription factor PdxR n=1 Tax=Quadrisphaera TaxID=317661 RepID=UPI0016441582|nr:PLP-dependent aminotransferase family protein [Quadrisphaera sp. RL12-1S]MBC3761456.1 PLP-dependent aminotransferase family protein [Quadrisphaera sp. RL12-1S]